MKVRLFSLIEPICWGGGSQVFIDLRRLPHTLSLSSLCPLLGRAGIGGQYLSKMGTGSLSRIFFGVIGSETNREGAKSFN